MPDQSDEASKLREQLLADYDRLEVFAAEFGRTPTTARRWVRDLGLPTIKIGSQLYIHVAGARAKMTGQLPPVPVLPPPRGRGRPRKTTTVPTPAHT